ncbi:MAG: tRNA dihydrouridine(20/20a) synthase DusA [Pantoea sp. Brub]|nr:tRNA dihydrouridine(20/20a) synthase DusA [Pantoea sp. Brub]
MNNIQYSTRFSVAPMFSWTDRHCRYLHRQLTYKTLLYTEMISTNAIIHGKYDYLFYHRDEHPVAIQLGGSKTKDLAYCAKLAEKRGYDEINLNIGCPSLKVQNSFFGAYLMSHANIVSDHIKAICDIVDIPVTIKTRVGIDKQDNFNFLNDFIGIISELSNCKTFIIHARKALLKQLNPKENRTIPPLNYHYVYRIKRNFPFLNIIINGGIQTLEEAQIHLQYLDGVMMGREAYTNPVILTQVDDKLFGYQNTIFDPIVLIHKMNFYINHELSKGVHIKNITRHMINLFKGIPGAKKWRRFISEDICKTGNNYLILQNIAKSLLNII